MSLNDIYSAAAKAGLTNRGEGNRNIAPGAATGTGTRINPQFIGGKAHMTNMIPGHKFSQYGPIDMQSRFGGWGFKGGAKYDPLTGKWGKPIFPYEWPNSQRTDKWYKYKW
jgi:hypothetical protein